MNHLSSEYKIRSIAIPNRIVMPPMLTFFFGQADCCVTERHISHYEARAKGGAGLIIIEATAVTRSGVIAEKQLGLWDDAQIDGFSRLAQTCHRHGAKVLVQLLHAGVNGNASFSDFAAPSDCDVGGKHGYLMSLEQIETLKRQFIAAAGRAKAAGTDGIELHGAHNYLLSRFFDPRSNRRSDGYGGSAQNRARLITEIISGIRAKCGEDFIIACRLGGNIPDRPGAEEIMHELEGAGIDLIHISFGISNEFSRQDSRLPEGFPCSVAVYNAVQLKKVLHVPVIAVVGIRTPAQARYLIENDLSDFVAVGFGMLADEDWAAKALAGSPVNACLNCKYCVWNPSWAKGNDPSQCPAGLRSHQ